MAQSCKPMNFFPWINLIIENHKDISPENFLLYGIPNMQSGLNKDIPFDREMGGV